MSSKKQSTFILVQTGINFTQEIGIIELPLITIDNIKKMTPIINAKIVKVVQTYYDDKSIKPNKLLLKAMNLMFWSSYRIKTEFSQGNSTKTIYIQEVIKY